MQKRGIEFPTLILLVVIGILVVSIIIYAVIIFFGYINSNEYEIATSNNGELSVIENSLVYDKNADYVSFKIRRESEYGEISGLKAVIYDEDENGFEYNESFEISPYETKDILINLLGKVKSVKKISIFPIYFDESSGEEKVGDVSSDIELTKKKVSPIFVGGGSGGGSGGGGGSGSSGTTSITTTTSTNSICGNGKIESGEGCDDGNLISKDGCSSSCNVDVSCFITYDVDNDGYNWSYCGGNDCNDNDALINPNGLEVCTDYIDNDCDGYADCSDSVCSGNNACIYPIFDLSVTNVSSSTISLDWNDVSGASKYEIYVAPEPSDLGNYAWMKKMGETTNANYKIEGLAASVDSFVRVEALDSSNKIIGVGNAYSRTPGNYRDRLIYETGKPYPDTDLREVHLVSPNIIEIVLTNRNVWSYSRWNDWGFPSGDGGVNKVINYSGYDWQYGKWNITRKDGSEIVINQVYRNSRPVGQFEGEYGYQRGIYANLIDVDHHIFLVLDQDIGNKEILTINHSGSGYTPVGVNIDRGNGYGDNVSFGENYRSSEIEFELLFSDKYLETNSIQLNQISYSPKAKERWAYVSNYLGDGGLMKFEIFPKNASVLLIPNNGLVSRSIIIENLGLSERNVLVPDLINLSGYDMGIGSCMLLCNLNELHSQVNNETACFVYYNESGSRVCIPKLGWNAGSYPKVDYDEDVNVKGDLGGVYEINLSSLPASESATYRIYIPGVGVSYETHVSNQALFKALFTALRGVYINRWGRDLECQWTDWCEREPDHPYVYTSEKIREAESGAEFFSSKSLLVGRRALQGGHHDAGDFDMHTGHVYNAFKLLRTYENNPEYFYDNQFIIPESGNGIPDILDEALYSLAVWEQLQEPNDLVGNACDICNGDPENDIDGDGVCKIGQYLSPMTGTNDNCAWEYNPSQEDSDGDGKGDACDSDYNLDSDGDSILGSDDNCLLASNADQKDSDGDFIGDVCDICILDSTNDLDGDGICGNIDNCPLINNPSQTDCDFNEVGDVCDYESDCAQIASFDSDGVHHFDDNCPETDNPLQEDNSDSEIGGIRGGVESWRHPDGNYFSDDEPEEKLPYWTYSRSTGPTMKIAGIMAKASGIVREFDEQKADELLNEALLAYNYALANGYNETNHPLISIFVNGELYNATGETKYKNKVEQTWNPKLNWNQGPGVNGVYPWGSNSPNGDYLVMDMMFGYFKGGNLNQTIVKQALASTFNNHLSNSIYQKDVTHKHRTSRPSSGGGWGEKTAVGIYMRPVYDDLYLDDLGIKSLTQEERQKRIDALSINADYLLGANPEGRLFLTGLGSRVVNNPLWLDSQAFQLYGMQAIPGYHVFGPAGVPWWGAAGYEMGEMLMYPFYNKRSIYNRYLDIWTSVTSNEGGPALSVEDVELLAKLIDEGQYPPVNWLPGQKDHKNQLATFGSADLTPPTIPTSLNAVANNHNSVNLSWSESSDIESEVLWYRIYRNGELINTTEAYSGDTSYFDSNLSPSTSYSYQVSSVNIGFFESVKSSIKEVSTKSDSEKPFIESYNLYQDSKKLVLIFNEKINKADAENVANYQIDNGIIINSASLLLDGKTVIVRTSSHDPRISYKLNYNNIKDLSNNIGSNTLNYKYSYVPEYFEKYLVWNGDAFRHLESTGEQYKFINKTTNPNDIFQGEWSFKGTIPDAWHSTSLNLGPNTIYRMSLNKYDTIIFWAKTNISNKNLTITFSKWSCPNGVINTNQYIEENSFDDKYRLITIPFSDITDFDCIKQNGMERIIFSVFRSGESGYLLDNTPIFIDEIWVVNSSSAFSNPLLSPSFVSYDQIKGENIDYNIENSNASIIFEFFGNLVKNVSGYIVKMFK